MFILLLYIASFTSLAGWFLYKDDETKRRVLGSIFLLSFLGYTSSALIFSPALTSTKSYLINLLFLFGGNLILNTFSNSKIVFGAMLLVAISGYYYLNQQDTEHIAPVPKNLDPRGELFLKLSEGYQLAELSDVLGRYELKTQRAFVVEDSEITELDDYYVIDIPEDKMNRYNQIVQDVRNSGLIDHLETNEQIQLDKPQNEQPVAPTVSKDFGINDPELDKLWGFEAMEVNLFYKFLKEKKAKPIRRAKIAIIDTGVDSKHEDLSANYVSTRTEYDTDLQGHGTHCAGIAAAVSNNNRGIASLAIAEGFVEVTSIKVFGSSGRTTQRTIINGMLLAADQGADVLSMSLGGPSSDQSQLAYRETIDYVNAKGGIVIVAAGNERTDAKKRVPAGLEGVITVSAIDEKRNLASFSNYIQHVDMGIAAPGVRIYSTVPNNSYKYFSGTSMATPYVAGLVGVVKSMKPNLGTKEVYELLQATGKDTKQPLKTGKLIHPLGIMQEILK